MVVEHTRPRLLRAATFRRIYRAPLGTVSQDMGGVEAGTSCWISGNEDVLPGSPTLELLEVHFETLSAICLSGGVAAKGLGTSSAKS